MNDIFDDHDVYNSNYNNSKNSGLEVCPLHENFNKEVGVIKNLSSRVDKKVDKLMIMILILIGVMSIDTLILLWKPISNQIVNILRLMTGNC